MNLLDKFYSSFMQEIVSRQLANEDGETQEQAFTRYVLDLLSEAGETENAAVAFDEKALGTSKQHKINGFAISDNYETIDLFISLYEVEEQVYTVQKSEVTRAATRITNFFRKAVYDDYVNEVAESSEIFEFAHTLANYGELKDNLIRLMVNIKEIYRIMRKYVDIKSFIELLILNTFTRFLKNLMFQLKLILRKKVFLFLVCRHHLIMKIISLLSPLFLVFV